MSADLGARLQRAGLVTREQLAETLATAPLHGSAFVRALVRRGVSEDALVGYFVAEGFGPLMGPADLASADPTLLAKIPASVMREFAVLPVRIIEGSWIVAMLAPTERHVVAELERMSGARVIPAAARWTDLRSALADVGAAHEAEAPEAPSSEPPPVIELVRRRPSHAPADTGYRASEPSRREEKLTGDALDPTDAVPLVRHKPLAQPSPSSPPPEKIIAKSFAPPRETTPTRGVWARGKSTTVPMDPDEPPPERRSSSGSTPAIVPPTALELATASAVDALPATAPIPLLRHAPIPSRTETREMETLPSAEAEPAAAPAESPPRSVPPARPSVPPRPVEVPRPSEPYVRRAVSDGPPVAQRPAVPRTPTLAPPGLTAPTTTPTPTPVEVEQPAPSGDDSWSIPPAGPRPRPRAGGTATNKLSARATRDLAPMKAPLGDVRGVLVSIRQATERDEVVRLTLDGALSVSRSAVFFALRRGLLKGWDGIGSGVSEDSARNLWIPTSTASLFQRVVESGVGYFGPYGAAIADGLFRAAVGSRGGDLALLPIKVSGKVVGLLACDDVRAGPQGQQRLELLATAVEEAFSRIIVQQKRG